MRKTVIENRKSRKNIVSTTAKTLPQNCGKLFSIENTLPQSCGKLFSVENTLPQSCGKLFSVENTLPQSYGKLSAVADPLPESCGKLSAVAETLPESIGKVAHMVYPLNSWKKLRQQSRRDVACRVSTKTRCAVETDNYPSLHDNAPRKIINATNHANAVETHCNASLQDNDQQQLFNSSFIQLL